MNEELIFNEVDTSRIQYIAIAGSVILLLVILELIRSKKIKEEYSLLWLLFSIVILLISIFRGFLEVFSEITGIAYAPAALFLLLIMAVFVILIQFSVIISKMSERNKKLNQEVGILKMEMEEMKERGEKRETKREKRKDIRFPNKE